MKNQIINLLNSPLLPICAEDAPQFSNDVYNKEYTREKIASRFKQSGRSMIEMLGVLAIVGVLSVGGIAGYSKAMQKYRTNKTIEQVTQIINGVRTLYSQQKNYEGISTKYSGPIRKAKILPESAWESTDSDPKNPFGGEYYVASASYNKDASLRLSNIPDDACVELATQDWGAGEGLFAVAIHNSGDVERGCSGESGSDYVLGCAGASGSGSVPLPIPMDYAMEACTHNDNYMYFYFY